MKTGQTQKTVTTVARIGAVVSVASMLLLAGCNNAKIPDGGKVMHDAEDNAFLVKSHFGNVYTLDPLPGDGK